MAMAHLKIDNEKKFEFEKNDELLLFTVTRDPIGLNDEFGLTAGVVESVDKKGRITNMSVIPHSSKNNLFAGQAAKVTNALPLSGGSIGFTRASRWASVGRIVSINNLRDAYGDDELDHALQMIDRTRIIDADLTQLADLARLAIDAQRLCISSLDQQPIDTGSYSGQQIISDRRFRACGMRSWPGP